MHNPGRGMGRQAGSMEAQAGGMGAQAGGYYQQPPQAQGRGSSSGSRHHRMQGETMHRPALVDCHVYSPGGQMLLANGRGRCATTCSTLWLAPHVPWGAMWGPHGCLTKLGGPACATSVYTVWCYRLPRGGRPFQAQPGIWPWSGTRQRPVQTILTTRADSAHWPKLQLPCHLQRKLSSSFCICPPIVVCGENAMVHLSFWRL